MTRRRRVVFITSLGHSGSTILHLVLASHTRAFGLGELASARRRLERETPSAGLCGVCPDACRFWDLDERRPFLKKYFGGFDRGWLRWQIEGRAGAFKGDLYRTLFSWLGEDAIALVDSSKSPGWIKRQLRPWWHWRDCDPYLVYLARDGRAVLNSRLRKHPDLSVDRISKVWLAGVRARERLFARFPVERRVRVGYERFALEPEIELRRLCAALHIRFEPQMLRYWEGEHHPVAGNVGAYLSMFVAEGEKRTEVLEHHRARSQAERLTDLRYYESVGAAIRADFRWTTELSEANLARFQDIVGNANDPYAFEVPKV